MNWGDRTSKSILHFPKRAGPAQAAAALQYMMDMPALKATMVSPNPDTIKALGGRSVKLGRDYKGFRNFEIARIEHDCVSLTHTQMRKIEALALEVCSFNENRK